MECTRQLQRAGRTGARQNTGRWNRRGRVIELLDVELSTSPRESSQDETGLMFESTSQPVLRSGSRGSSVTDLQTRLAHSGFNPGSVDGIFGSRTSSAVRSFQAARSLKVDGIVGPATWTALLGAPAAPGAPPIAAPVTADVWALPESVRLAGEAMFIRYDPPPAWTGPEGCIGPFTAGAAALRSHILANFAGVASIGGFSCRQNTANPAETSVHGAGRALDIMINTIGGRANSSAGDPIANWLVRNAQAIGVQYLIWNRTQWSGARSGRKDRAYTGPIPHVDHLHVEVNLDAAQRKTPWFTGRE